MKFSGREDIDAPATEIFARLVDFEAHERAVMRRGVTIKRLDGLSEAGPGMAWNAEVKFRGKIRNIGMELTHLNPCETVLYEMNSSGLSGDLSVDVLALSPRRSRLAVAIDIKPKNLTGRLLIQSLRLLKPSLDRKFKARVSTYGRLLSGDAKLDGF